MQLITITGRVGGNAETREAGSSNVTNFNVAVDQGYGNDKTTNWYRCAIWGDRGTKLREHIRKGDKVALTGELVIGEYQGKPQYEIRVSDIDPFMAPKQDVGGTTPRSPQPVDQELEDDVPFALIDMGLEHRVS